MSGHQNNNNNPRRRQGEESDDNFQARPSRSLGRTGPSIAQADGSSWQEYLAVCEIQDQLQVRSYFENQQGKRVWDEPPSGASHIIPATDEMRRMATLQLDDLCVATTNGENDGDDNQGKRNNSESGKKKKRGGIKSLFGKLGGGRKDTKESSQSNKKIQYKPGSNLLASGNETSASRSMRADPHLQAAIAQSLAESSGIVATTEQQQSAFHTDEDPELARAMALSLGAAPSSATPASHNTTTREESEEEMLRRVLEQSKLDS